MSFWKTIPGFPAYEVSSAGQVRRVGSNVCLTPYEQSDYLQVHLYNAGARVMRRVHTLVLEAHVGPRPVGQVARHLNGNAKDCKLSNLAWGTAQENAEDKALHGTAKGERNPRAKLSQSQVEEIRGRAIPGPTASNLADLASEFEVSISTVSRIRRNETYQPCKET